MSSAKPEGFLPPHGNYRGLLSCQKADQANFLLDRQIRRLERDFVTHGGLRERMTAARLNRRASFRR